MVDQTRSNPKAAENLEINQLSDGCIVYQPDRDRVHYLNQTATVVLELCNGRNSEAEISSLLRFAYELQTEPVDEVGECLQTLRREGLVA